MKTRSRHLPSHRSRALVGTALLVSGVCIAADPPDQPSVRAASAIDAGRYLVTIGGCHDCHTNGWAESGGRIPEADTLTGSPMGWRGPWGTTYASNLRIVASEMTEDAWVTMLRQREMRPPMPWMNTAKLSESDSRAIHRYLVALGVAGERMPAYVDPASEPLTPYLRMEPVGPVSAGVLAEYAPPESR